MKFRLFKCFTFLIILNLTIVLSLKARSKYGENFYLNKFASILQDPELTSMYVSDPSQNVLSKIAKSALNNQGAGGVNGLAGAFGSNNGASGQAGNNAAGTAAFGNNANGQNNAFNNNGNGFNNGVGGANNGFNNNGSLGGNGSNGFGNNAGGLGSNNAAGGNGFLGGAMGSLNNAGNANNLGNNPQGLLNNGLGGVGNGIPGANNVLGGANNGFGGPGNANNVNGAFGAGNNNLNGNLGNGLLGAANNAFGAANNALGAANNAFGAANNALGGIAGAANNALGPNNAIGSLANGLQGAVNNVNGALGAANKAVGALGNTLGLNNPNNGQAGFGAGLPSQNQQNVPFNQMNGLPLSAEQANNLNNGLGNLNNGQGQQAGQGPNSASGPANLLDATNPENSSANSQLKIGSDAAKVKSRVDDTNSDLSLKKIQEHIYNYATLLKQTKDKTKKMKINGIPMDSYTDEMKAQIKDFRMDKKKWNPILNAPTAVWRFCVYPSYAINYVNWMERSFPKSERLKNLNQNNFCVFCCYNSQFILKYNAESNPVGDLLQLRGEVGLSSIKSVLSDAEISKCEATCNEQYKATKPIVHGPPARDPELGTKKEKPAKSCMDIKKWGCENAMSGIYWIEVNKSLLMAYCDMETDEGGWTLFLAYNHDKGQELSINGSRLPNNPKSNSHVNLADLGVDERYIKELRFYCYENFMDNITYMHFKIQSPEFIKTALTGDQTYLKSDLLEKYYVPLPETKELGQTNNKKTPAIDPLTLKTYRYVGSNKAGGLFARVFGSDDQKSFWTIKGGDNEPPVYECGTDHHNGSARVKLNDPSNAKTHHSIWFRGQPASEQEARNRYYKELQKDLGI